MHSLPRTHDLFQGPGGAAPTIEVDGPRTGRPSGGETGSTNEQRVFSRLIEAIQQGKGNIDLIGCQYVRRRLVRLAGRGSQALRFPQLAQGM